MSLVVQSYGGTRPAESLAAEQHKPPTFLGRVFHVFWSSSDFVAVAFEYGGLSFRGQTVCAELTSNQSKGEKVILLFSYLAFSRFLCGYSLLSDTKAPFEVQGAVAAPHNPKSPLSPLESGGKT